MGYPAAVLEVMLSAPADLAKEVDVMANVIRAWNDANSRSRKVVLLPMHYRSQAVPEVGGHPQSIINRQMLEHCDVLVAAFWTRLGSPTQDYESGTVEEIDRHAKAGKPALVYFCKASPALAQIDEKQLAAVREFEERIRHVALCGQFDSTDQLLVVLNTHLSKLMNENPYVQATLQWHGNLLQEAAGPMRPLSNLAKQILSEAVRGNGLVSRLTHMHGLSISAGRVEFTHEKDPRSEADAEAALEELEQNNLVQDRTGERRNLHVTRLGYELIDRLPSKEVRPEREKAYRELIDELVSARPDGRPPMIATQTAVVAQLRNYPEFSEPTTRILVGLREQWRSNQNTGPLIAEIDLTIAALGQAIGIPKA